MFRMWNVRDVGYWRCGMLEMWDIGDVGCSGCGMLEMWDVRDVGCWGFGLLGMWDVWDAGCSGCSGCGMFAGMWDVDLQNAQSTKPCQQRCTIEVFGCINWHTKQSRQNFVSIVLAKKRMTGSKQTSKNSILMHSGKTKFLKRCTMTS